MNTLNALMSDVGMVAHYAYLPTGHLRRTLFGDWWFAHGCSELGYKNTRRVHLIPAGLNIALLPSGRCHALKAFPEGKPAPRLPVAGLAVASQTFSV